MSGGPEFLGKYRLIKLLRSGQTAQIWEAVRDGETKKVALKLLQEKHKKNKRELALLKQEFEVGGSLDHRYLIKIHEFNNSHKIPFVAMELFNHKNMKQALREDAERLAYQAPLIIRRCAKALAYLHKEGWVHCDVKPDNFLIDPKATVKLLDFAIARKPQKSDGLLSGLLGGSKTIAGTRSYISPEQIRSKAVDERSDIYSFGCMVFEILGGKLPYSGVNSNDLLSKHLRAQIPSVVSVNKIITSEMGELIQEMMAKKKEDRPDSMKVFLDRFKKLKVFRPGKHPPNPDEETSSEADAKK